MYKYVLIAVQSQLPAAALEADLNLQGAPWARRGGDEQRAETSFGSCMSHPASLLCCQEAPLPACDSCRNAF